MSNKNVGLEHRQPCSYYHWMLHAERDRKKKKYSTAQNFGLINKKQSSIAKLLNDIHQKPRDPSQRTKTCDTASVLIPTDPSSPYAFTLNVANSPKTKRNNIPSHDQVSSGPGS